MRIISRFLFVLITGILSSTNAQTDLQSLCTENGGPQAYGALESISSNFERCYQPVTNQVYREIERANGAIDNAFVVYCRYLPTLRNCVKLSTDVIKSCLGPASQPKAVIDVIYDVAVSLLQFSCENANLLKKGFDSPDRGCPASKLQGVKYCVNKIIMGRKATFPSRLTPETDPIAILSILKNSFDSQDCSEVKYFEECSIEVLQECEDQIFSEMLDSTYKYINHHIPCKELPRSLSPTNTEAHIRSLCTKNGGPWAYEAFKRSWSNVQECFSSVMNEVTVDCDTIQTLRHCVKDFTQAIKSCLGPHQHELIDMGYNIASSGLQFACENQEIVEDMLDGPDSQCFVSELQALKNCGYKFILGRNSVIPYNTLLQSDPLHILSALKIDFDNHTCRDIRKLERCSVKVLEKCKNGVFRKTLNSLYKYINNDIPCENLPKSPRSVASPNSVISVVLLVIAAITMHF